MQNVYRRTDTGNIGASQRFFLSACCFLTNSAAFPLSITPGVRIVVASPIFPKKAYRGRKETGRAVLFT